MKKDMFNGKIKHEYIAYVWVTIVLFTLIFIGVGSLILYSAFQYGSGSADRNGLLLFGILFCIIGVSYFVLAIVSARRYPQYPRLRRLCFNADVYFAGSDSTEYRGHWWGIPAFCMVTHIAGQNKGLENIKYPLKYKVYIALCILGIGMMFANIWWFAFLMDNLDVLPRNLQDEGLVFGAFIVLEIVSVVLSFVFAFRVKNIRKTMVDKYKKLLQLGDSSK